MPNWCVTDIEVSGKKDELSKLYDLINTWGQKSLEGDSNGDYFFFRFKDEVELTDIVKYAEIFTEDELNSLSIRGNLEDMQIQNDGSLLIRVTNPWNPMLLMWVRIFDKYLTDYTMYYMSEESGEGIYITNNPKYIGTYNFDVKDRDSLEEKLGKDNVPETESYVPEKRIIEILQNLLESELNDIDELITKFNSSYYIDDISINKFDFVPIEDIL